MYALGVDLGTTFTAASTWRDGHAEIASLGSRAAVIPSVVLLREDETILTGETASRRGLSEPHRVAREFKRRLGDTTPILLGGVPYSAEALMSGLLRSVVDAVSSREGGPPSTLCVSHPANWGPYKTDLLRHAVRLAGLEMPVTYTTEPEAAAAFYARQQRIQPGAVVAVYDLGGGTFDAAVLRKTQTGFEILGQPEGIERLGGIDIDAAVFDHVRRALGGKLEELDENDPVAIAAVGRLREECVQAKEALSSDTDVAIAVLLPNVSTEVRLTRAELEAMVRPVLHSSVEALKRALRSASVTPEQLHSVVLVGGSSRMPIVAQLVGAELGRPVAVDAHPKHAVALGAAWLASGAPGRQQASRGVATVVMPAATAAGAAAAAAAAAGAGAPPPPQAAVAAAHQAPMAPPPVAPPVGQPPAPVPRAPGPVPQAPGPPVQGPPVSGPPGSGQPVSGPPVSGMPVSGMPVSVPPVSGPPISGPPISGPPVSGPPGPRPPQPGAPMFGAPLPGGPPPAGPPFGPPPGGPPFGGPPPGDFGGMYGPPPPPARPGSPKRRRIILIAAAVATMLALSASAAIAWTLRDDGTGGTANPPSGASQSQDPTEDPTEEPSPSVEPSETPDTVPADEQCTDEIKSNAKWVCLTKATISNSKLTIEYEASWDGATPNVSGGFHLHIYGGDGTNPADEVMGTHASNPGKWYVEDNNPSAWSTSSANFVRAVKGHPKVCARIADSKHRLVPDDQGGGKTYHTGNCVPITNE